MVDEQIAQTREWVMKAASDTRSARVLAAMEPPATDTSAFHCQQAVEKLFKAFLTYHAQVFEKTHHLALLCSQCMEIDKEFEALMEAVERVQDYAVGYRYPGEVDPTLDELRRAMGVVDQVWSFLSTHLSARVFDGIDR